MKTTAAPHVIEATASLLSEDSDLSNAELLRRLTIKFGEKEMRAILVTRFQRQVREPALRLLQDRLRTTHANNGRKAESSTLPPEPRREKAAAPPPRNGSSERPRRAMEPGRLRAVDAALERAFRLGAVAGTPTEIVEAFRELEKLRLDVRKSLEGSG